MGRINFRQKLAGLLVIAVGICLGSGCGHKNQAAPPPLFRLVTAGDLPELGVTHGGTLLDLDNDGFLDLLAPDPAARIDLFRNDGQLGFAKLGRLEYPGLARSAARGQAACDFDNDGDWDVFVSTDTDSGRAFGPNHLWQRAGGNQFVDVAAENPVLVDPIGRGQGGVWADFDGDTKPELLVLNFQSQTLLAAPSAQGWRNVTARLPWPPSVAMDSRGLPPEPRLRARSSWLHAALAADLDNDSRPDLLAIGRPGWSGLMLNQGAGNMADRTATSGLKHAFWPKTPQHVAMGDINEDGRPDLAFCYWTADEFTRSYLPLELWLNNSQPGRPDFELQRFVERTDGGPALLAAVKRPDNAILADLDNDGHLDLYVVQPGRTKGETPNLIYQGHGDATFTDVSTVWGGGGPPDSAPESAWAVDLDNDGDLDLVTFNGGDPYLMSSLHRGVALYENLGTGGLAPLAIADGPQDDQAIAAAIATAAAASGNRGITVQLRSRVGPAHGLGAVATLVSGDSRQTCWSGSRTSGLGSAILPLHFGVGRAEGPFRLEIRWASGQEQVISLPNAGRGYVVSEGDSVVSELPQRAKGDRS